MEVAGLKAQIKAKKLDTNFYIFTGDEVKVQDIFIEQMAKLKNLDVVRVDNVASIYSKMSNKSLFDKKCCYVVRDDKEFMTYEKAWPTITSVIGENMLIFRLSNIDKRSKFYKHFKDEMIEFAPMKDSMLVKYIQKDIDLSEAACLKLIEVCESDYNRILLEIDKIKCYCEDKFDYNSGFEHLLNTGIIYQPPKDAVFDLVDAILKRNARKSFELYDHCKRYGEANMIIISNLYRTAKHTLQIQSCHSQDVSKSTGLTGWEIKCAKDKVGFYKISELVNMLKLIRNVEKGIKTGAIEDEISVDYIMASIL